MFEILIWAGTVLTLIGLAGLIWCIVRVARARRAGLADEALRDLMRGIIPTNMAALFLSVLGLMLVVIGVMLG